MRIHIVKDSAINKRLENIVEPLEKNDILDLGSGMDTGKFLRLDIDKNTNPDFHMDLRAFCGIAPYDKDLYRYCDVRLLDRQFNVIRAIHFLEHIEWIYQETILSQLKTMLIGEGCLFIEVPSLRYIIDMYNKQIDGKLLKGKLSSFPDGEYTFSDSDPMNIYKWLNFRIFSGCSPGDNHKCLYDIYSLHYALEKIGFEHIILSNESTIKCLAFAPESAEYLDIELRR